jgi:hypothetical protein
MKPEREENTADSPPHADPQGVNPAGLGPAQPEKIENASQQPAPPEPAKPGESGDRTKDPDAEASSLRHAPAARAVCLKKDGQG